MQGKKGKESKTQAPHGAGGDEDEDGNAGLETMPLIAECGLEEQVLQVLLQAGAADLP